MVLGYKSDGLSKNEKVNVLGVEAMLLVLKG
jgi:hypothetical protein